MKPSQEELVCCVVVPSVTALESTYVPSCSSSVFLPSAVEWQEATPKPAVLPRIMEGSSNMEPPTSVSPTSPTDAEVTTAPRPSQVGNRAKKVPARVVSMGGVAPAQRSEKPPANDPSDDQNNPAASSSGGRGARPPAAGRFSLFSPGGGDADEGDPAAKTAFGGAADIAGTAGKLASVMASKGVAQIQTGFNKLPDVLKVVKFGEAGVPRQSAYAKFQTPEEQSLSEQRAAIREKIDPMLERTEERADLMAVLKLQPECSLYEQVKKDKKRQNAKDLRPEEDMEIGIAQMRELMSMKAPRQPGPFLERAYIEKPLLPPNARSTSASPSRSSPSAPSRPASIQRRPSALFATAATSFSQASGGSRFEEMKVLDLSPVPTERRLVLEKRQYRSVQKVLESVPDPNDGRPSVGGLRDSPTGPLTMRKKTKTKGLATATIALEAAMLVEDPNAPVYPDSFQESCSSSDIKSDDGKAQTCDIDLGQRASELCNTLPEKFTKQKELTDENVNLIPCRIDWDKFKDEVDCREKRRHRITVELAELGVIVGLPDTKKSEDVINPMEEWLEMDRVDTTEGSVTGLSSVQVVLKSPVRDKKNVREEVLFSGRMSHLVYLSQIRYLREATVRPMLHLMLDLPSDPTVIEIGFEYELDRVFSASTTHLQLPSGHLRADEQQDRNIVESPKTPPIYNLVMGIRTGVSKEQFPLVLDSMIFNRLKDSTLKSGFAERCPLITILFSRNLVDTLNTLKVFGPLLSSECTVFLTSFESSAVRFFETFPGVPGASAGELPPGYMRLSDVESFRPILGEEASNKYLHPSFLRLPNFIFDEKELTADVEKRVPQKWRDRHLPKKQQIRRTFQRAVHKVQERLHELNPRFGDIVRMLAAQKHCPDISPGATLFQYFIPADEAEAAIKAERKRARAQQGSGFASKSRAPIVLEE